MKNDDSLNIILFISIAMLVYSFVADNGVAPIANTIGIKDQWSNYVSWKDRPVVKDVLEGLATAVEQDGKRPEDEQYTPDRDGAFEDLFHVLHHQIGPDAPKLSSSSPGLADQMVDRMGTIPEFPKGRAVFVQKLREIAGEL